MVYISDKRPKNSGLDTYQHLYLPNYIYWLPTSPTYLPKSITYLHLLPTCIYYLPTSPIYLRL